MKIHTIKPDTNKTLVVSLGENVRDIECMVLQNAKLTLVLSVLNANNVDARVTVRLAGAGAEATIIGIVIGSGDAKIRLHTLQLHEAPGTTSNLLVKTALSDQAICIIDGGIRVEKTAQKTDAYQRNENLLLSKNARAESKPSLEILANDVRCTHGATVGPVSKEELWYLASRGITRRKAEFLLVSGFFRKAVEMIKDELVRETFWKSVEGAL